MPKLAELDAKQDDKINLIQISVTGIVHERAPPMSFQHLTELLALCKSITADKKLSKEELKSLRDWLVANKDADIAVIGQLTKSMGMIVADGKVTAREHAELIANLESIAGKLQKK